MPEAFYVSDTHFNHARILKHCAATRGRFASVHEHDEHLIRAWNERVGPFDDVWHLGDFGHTKDPDHLDAVFSRLNGHKRLIVGNHDDEITLMLGWAETPALAAEIMDGTTRVVLSHFPYRSWHWRMKSVHLYGHCHGTLPGYGGPKEKQGLGGSCDVGVDVWDLKPVTLREVRRRIRTFPFEPKTLRAYEDIDDA